MKGKHLLLTGLLVAFGFFTYAGKNPNVPVAKNSTTATNVNLTQQNYKGLAPAEIDAEPGALYSSTYRKVDPALATKAPFDIDIQEPVGTLLNQVSLTGIAWTGTEFWVSQWNSDSLWTVDINGNITDRFTVAGVTGTRSLTWDGTSIYAGGAGSSIAEINPTTKTVTSTITLAAGNVGARMCAYDPNADGGNGGFWIGNFTSNIQLYSMTGTQLLDVPQASHGLGGIYGGAVDTSTAGGPYLLVYAQGSAGGDNIIHWVDIANPSTPTGLSLDVNKNVIPTGIAGGAFVAHDIIAGESHLLTITQHAGNYLTAYELALPPPPTEPMNDDICDAIELDENSGPIIGTNEGATVEVGEPSGSNWFTTADATVWYYFVAQMDTTYLVNTNIAGGVNDDTQLASYDAAGGGCTGTLTEINSNDDISATNFYAVDTVPALIGDTVWIQVDGWQTTEGTFWLDIEPFVPSGPPGNASRDFEAYAAGDWVAESDPEWATWSGPVGPGTEDALISDAQAQSGTKSVVLELGTTDVIYLLGDQTTGTWGAGFSMYVPTGNSAYYNIQETQVPATRWVVEVNMDDGGTGSFTVSGTTYNFTYPMDTWFDVRHYIDLDNSLIQIFVDGNFAAQFSYTHNGGTNTLGAFNFFPTGGNGPGLTHYVDDMFFQTDTLRTPPAPDYDAGIDGARMIASGLAGYTNVPPSQNDPSVFKAIVVNNGAMPVTGVTVNGTVNPGANSVTGSLASIADFSADVVETNGFAVTPGASYSGAFDVTIVESDGDPGNDNTTFDFDAGVLADTTFAREAEVTPPANGVGFTGGTGRLVNMYEFTSDDTITSITAVFNGAPADQFEIFVADFDFLTASSNAEIYNSGAISTTTADITHAVNIPVSAGTYVVGINQTATNNIALELTTNVVRDNTAFFGTLAGWTDVNSLGVPNLTGTFLIRVGLGVTNSIVSLGPYNLVSPADGTQLQVSAGSTDPVVIDWDASTPNPASATVTYKWLVDAPGGDFSNPLIELDADNNGEDDQLSLTAGDIDAALANLAIPVNQPEDLIWTVQATAGATTAFAGNGPFDINIERVVGLSQDYFDANVNLYPNPASDELIIEVQNDLVKNLVIKNMIGQTEKAFENVQSRNVIDLSDLSSGMYLVKFVTENGEYTKKLVVE